MNQCSELGALIKKQLVLLHKNQNWLAEQCDVTRGQISHIMVGRCKLSLKMIESLSKALEVDYKALIEASIKK